MLSNRILYLLMSFIAMIVSGCINISTELQPINEAVRPIAKGLDCSVVLLGLGFGTNRIATAMQNGYIGTDRFSLSDRAPIRTIHSVVYMEEYYLVAGNRCLVVSGEP